VKVIWRWQQAASFTSDSWKETQWNIIIIIPIFIYCNWVVTRWQLLFYMYRKHEIGWRYTRLRATETCLTEIRLVDAFWWISHSGSNRTRSNSMLFCTLHVEVILLNHHCYGIWWNYPLPPLIVNSFAFHGSQHQLC
jgi:hypothetical protein